MAGKVCMGGVRGRGVCVVGDGGIRHKTAETATAADGKHLTGMHFCSKCFFFKLKLFLNVETILKLLKNTC